MGSQEWQDEEPQVQVPKQDVIPAQHVPTLETHNLAFGNNLHLIQATREGGRGLETSEIQERTRTLFRV